MAKRSKTVVTFRDKPDVNTVQLTPDIVPDAIKAREAMAKARKQGRK